MDSFFGIGFMELALIAILALIVLGPERLPGAAREIAKIYQQIRGLSTELTSQFSEELKILDDLNPQKLMNDLVQDAANPPKKKPKPRTKPLAPKKPVETKPVTETDPEDASAESAATDDTDQGADQAEENRILPPPLETAASGDEEPVTIETTVTDAADQPEENRILPPQPDEINMADDEELATTETHPDSNPAAPSAHAPDDAAVDATETTAQKQTDESA